ncbi:hypothetical protein M23134_05872 [Microscilla marina ATCC 23134]|uniref:Uncharacterized protein n=1 Tax=Microscilla marina ATCC 23134 TaxID=313606 RepID=A1ZXM2_MICM2|nr:hypothetical protein M23134_05872 [Microscilla marina ATCC 23134]
MAHNRGENNVFKNRSYSFTVMNSTKLKAGYYVNGFYFSFVPIQALFILPEVAYILFRTCHYCQSST